MPDLDSKVMLAIHAAGADASIAVGRGTAMLHIEPVSNAARHDDDLMPAVARSFARIGATPADLVTVAVSVGPGGFTGLRIAVSTAKMLALALDCRVVAVSEIDIVIQAIGPVDPLAICLAGKHGHYWTAFHMPGQSPIFKPINGQLLTIQEIVSRMAEMGISRIAISQPSDRMADLSATASAGNIDVTEVHPDASHVWKVACNIALAGRFTSPESLLPIYPREPEAVRLWRERHA